MIARGVTRADLETAAANCDGLRVDITNEGPRGIRFRLKTKGPRAKYRRISWINGPDKPRTIGGAVCWHGHRAFMRALYAIKPDARIESCLARYEGREHFERTHVEQSLVNRGERFGHEVGGDCMCGEETFESRKAGA